jgi:hypothetical protein
MKKIAEENQNTIINNNTTNNITNNITNNNITINITKYTLDDNIKFNSQHITEQVFKKLLKYCNNKIDRIFQNYAVKLLENPENRCVRKKHITNSFSEVHIGDNKWEIAPDKEVYNKLTQDIALDASNKLDEYEDLTNENVKNSMAELFIDKITLDKEYLPVFNLIKTKVLSMCVNYTKNYENNVATNL